MAKKRCFIVMLGLILASAVPVSIGAQDFSGTALAQAQMKMYSVSVTGNFTSRDGTATYITTKIYSIRAGSSEAARDEAISRFYSEHYGAHNVRARVG
jgi:outer membrane lipoprotein-sorting protein